MPLSACYRYLLSTMLSVPFLLLHSHPKSAQQTLYQHRALVNNALRLLPSHSIENLAHDRSAARRHFQSLTSHRASTCQVRFSY